MLNNDDLQRMHILFAECPDAKSLFDKVAEEHRFTISKISHEIRNPIALISSSLQLIQKEHPEVKDFAFWKETMEDVDFLCRLVNDLSFHQKSETIRSSRLDSGRFLNEIASSLDPAINDRVKDFQVEIANDLPVIYGDETKLQQALYNLLYNAFDALRSVPDGRVRLLAYAKGSDICIKICDNGCGIPEEHLETLFEPFVTHKADGTGLGLPISKKIIESHQGSLSVSSKQNIGTTFTILLPAVEQ